MRIPIVLAFILASAFGQQCLPDIERVDCHPDQNASPERCVQRGCTWCFAEVPGVGVPDCYFPRDFGYTMVGEPQPIQSGDSFGYRVELQRTTTSTLFGGDASALTLEIDFQSDYRLRIKISDGSPRWEVPLEIQPTSKAGNPDTALYEIFFTNVPTFSFKVVRKSSGTVLFDTSLGGFNFADQFIQLGIKLPSQNVYGIGENEQPTFKHSFKYQHWSLWANGQSPNGNANIYGVQPHYTVLENDGNAHAVAIVNSNAQEFVMHPNPGIVYRTIGGILDIYLFLGPTPENTVQQYTEAVGRYPMPPYWAMGFQLCRFGYDSMEEMKDTVDRMIASEIPYDVQYGDIDIMDRRLDFTVSPDRFAGLAGYVREWKTKGIKFMTILDPIISIGEPTGTYKAFDLGQEMDVWIKKADGTPVTGRMWPEDPVYFPDFYSNSTKDWWKILIKDFHDILEFDALWIDMNEPDSFIDGDLNEECSNSLFNNPPYMPHITNAHLYSRAPCSDHIDSMGIHYNTHNLFGWAQSQATTVAINEAVGKRSFALSRSTFLGSGRWVTHWLGDNFSRWSNLHLSIISMLQFNLFGIPFVGPDICGHQGDATEQLCQRWMELGAFYPFSRNHNAYGQIKQDPAAFGGAIIESSKKAMNVRYNLLPYLYTLLAHHEFSGETVARALWHEFPTDPEAISIDRQFLWGSGVLITPVLEENQTVVSGYFPNARFYDYYTGGEVAIRGDFVQLGAPLDHINVHIRGGSVIPTQEPAVNTELSRQNPFGFIVALDDAQSASGHLYYDAGDNLNPFQTGAFFSLQVTVANRTIDTLVEEDGYAEMANKTISTVKIMGAVDVSAVKVNGVQHSDFTVDSTTKRVDIFNLNLKPTVPFAIEF